MALEGQHVVPRDGKWAIIKGGAERATELFDTQAEAIDRGREIAKNQETELLIHGEDGQIRDRVSYGNDPYPPAG